MDFYDGLQFSLYGSIPEHFGESRNMPAFYGIQYNHAGSFWLRINGGKLYEMEGPFVFITHPGTYFEYGNMPGQTRHHNFICALGERIARYRDAGLLMINDESPLRRVCNPPHFLKTMQAIMALLRAAHPLVPPRAILHFEELLLQIRELSTSVEAAAGTASFSLTPLIDELRQHPQKEWDFAAEARERGITSTHFRRIFKAQTGLPPQQFLILCRMKFAALLLVNSSNSIAEIARKVGIENEYYFSRLFKLKYHLSPAKYRHEFLGFSRNGSPLPQQSDDQPYPRNQ